MNFEEWEPIYEEILADFLFSRKADEESALLLGHLLNSERIASPDDLRALIEDRTAHIFGDGENLEDEIAGKLPDGVLISADNATSRLLNLGLQPDIIVSDLDGKIDDLVFANKRGAVIVIHAHGDNMNEIRKLAPMFEGLVVASTQGRPLSVVHNFGGFTDGDRAVHIAEHFHSSRIVLYGFDFESPRNVLGKNLEIKKKKLEWAKRLINGVKSRGAVLSNFP